MFLKPSERLIVMNLPEGLPTKFGPCQALNDDELKRLRDAGIQVVLNYAHWRVIEAEGYEPIDVVVEQMQRIGLRCILASYVESAQNLPESFYCRQADGSFGCSEIGYKALSIWNKGATAAILQLYRDLIARYGGPDVLVIFSGLDTGEIVLPHKPSFYDIEALKSHAAEIGGVPDITTKKTQDWVRRSVVAHFLEIDGLLIEQHGEIWQALHPWLDWHRYPNGANGNLAQESILKAELERWPEAARTLLQYTYFHHGSRPVRGGTPYKELIDTWLRKYRLRVIVEADYCRGLKTTTPEAVSKGFAGQLVGVLHPWMEKGRVQQWHLDVVTESVLRWRGDL